MIFKHELINIKEFEYDNENGYLGTLEIRQTCLSVTLPDKHAFSAMISNPRRAIILPVGLSILSPKDKHNKKIARDVSIANTVPSEFIVRSLTFNDDGSSIFVLEGIVNHKKGEIPIILKVKMSEKKDKLILL